MELIMVTFQLLGQLDFVAVLVAALASFALGFLWYGPVFGKKWMKYMGVTNEDAKHMSRNKMIVAYVFAFITAFVEAMFLLFFAILFQTQLWHVALMVWFGFILFSETGIVFWGGKKWGLFALNASYRLVNLLAMGLAISFFY